MLNVEWETYDTDGLVERLKVDGGHIYKCGLSNSICFVPEVDLTRYQAHLRDAYNQGLKDGENYDKGYVKGCEEGFNKGYEKAKKTYSIAASYIE